MKDLLEEYGTVILTCTRHYSSAENLDYSMTLDAWHNLHFYHRQEETVTKIVPQNLSRFEASKI